MGRGERNRGGVYAALFEVGHEVGKLYTMRLPIDLLRNHAFLPFSASMWPDP